MASFCTNFLTFFALGLLSLPSYAYQSQRKQPDALSASIQKPSSIGKPVKTHSVATTEADIASRQAQKELERLTALENKASKNPKELQGQTPAKPQEKQAPTKAIATVQKKAPQTTIKNKSSGSRRRGGISMTYIDESIEKAAEKEGVPSDLLRAVCIAESNLDPSAFVPHDGGDNNHSFGMCQVLRKTAEEMNFRTDGCAENYRSNDKERKYKNCPLFGPYYNALAAARYLKMKHLRYGDWMKATAAFNTGSLKKCTTGVVKNQHGKTLYTCEKGGLLNEIYITRVAANLPENFFAVQNILAQQDALIN